MIKRNMNEFEQEVIKVLREIFNALDSISGKLEDIVYEFRGVDLQESESDLIGLKQAKRLILSSEEKGFGKPTEEDKREAEEKYPLKFNLKEKTK